MSSIHDTIGACIGPNLMKLILILFFGTTSGVDFNPYISTRQKSLTDTIGWSTKSSFIWCIIQCKSMADCVSVSYSASSSTCLQHNKHPLQATITSLPDYTLYYPYECPDEMHLFDQKCYVFSDDRLSWSAAKSFCGSFGGNIVKIETPEEQQFIRSTAASIPTSIGHYWIGAYYSSAHSTFLWYDDTDIEYESWGGTNPNSMTGCVDVVDNVGWDWNDHIDCNALLQYICEKDLIIQ